MRQITLDITEEDKKGRLDRFLTRRLHPEFSRSFLQKLISKGHVTLNGRVAKSHTKLKPGDKVEVTVPPPEVARVQGEDIPLDIVYEDERLVVVDKPAGMVVHPAAGNPKGTLVNALLFHCRDLSGIGGELRPGIVHRLDKDTSGLLVVAKDDAAHRGLSAQFKSRRIKRRYIAFVRGTVQLDNGRIDLPITRNKRHRQKMAVGFEGAREALTHYSVMKRYGDYTMLELVLGTGRTHQIRTHLEYLGHPLLGDRKYGRSCRAIARHALHAATLGFTHPATGEFMEFSSELPDDMKKLL
jgi:23S rRNA pseudouridine1911/1915/1917 synthase